MNVVKIIAAGVSFVKWLDKMGMGGRSRQISCESKASLIYIVLG